MKQLSIGFLRIVSVLVLTIMNMVAWAQDSTGTSSTSVTTETTTTTTTEWYTQPWVWIVGGAVFIIILIALLRGNSNKDTEVSRSSTTVIKDNR